MGLKSSLIIATALVLSTNVYATPIIHGNLTSDDTTNIFSDSLNSVEYLRLDVLADLNYDQTDSILDTQNGGGWSFAGAADAIGFISALFGGTSACSHDGVDVFDGDCGQLSGWTDGDFGDDYYESDDFAWFLDGQGEADFLQITSTGSVTIVDWTLEDSDRYSASGDFYNLPISWLLIRDTTSTVPEPSIAFLLASGLIAFGVVRRKRKV